MMPYRDNAAAPVLAQPSDKLERGMRDLRLSVLDRCNFRCSYCNPRTSSTSRSAFLVREDILGISELLQLANAFVSLGVKRVRLTGGEPLLRPDLCNLVQRLSHNPGIREISMTTNGVLLPKLADELAEAGLSRITVSLDSLDEAVFARMTGGRGSAARVLEGIAAAEAAGFAGLKINCVVHRGVNDHTVMDLLAQFRGTAHTVRLIEYLDVGKNSQWHRNRVVPGAEWLRKIHERWPLVPLESRHPGETARRFAYADGQGEIGLINSITEPFCGACSRVRVTADGTLYTCLFAAEGIPLRPLLRGRVSGGALKRVIRDAWKARADRYSELRTDGAGHGAGQEMYRMGG